MVKFGVAIRNYGAAGRKSHFFLCSPISFQKHVVVRSSYYDGCVWKKKTVAINV